ncbi:DAPK1 [Branchiostoma lanceolatum]|uniref:DAPK1 protein n=1 Tax=Branchiostoma lanceolatum TaxID=7740 RepID=A0A8K0ABB5_BRALA|nr:DAPK1 [Branchiostoma lanceolatum]
MAAAGSDDTFYSAVREGDVQTVRRGLEAGVDVRVKRIWYGLTSLHVASRYGQTEVAELLIENKADVDARDYSQFTPLHRAAGRGHPGTCELLIRHGADVTARDQLFQSTPLHWAAWRGHPGTCELLIRHGADVTARDEVGRTPLDKAEQETLRAMKVAIKEKSYHELLQKSGGVKVNRCKVFVFGKAETGKSTLKESLERGPVTALLQGLSKMSSAEEPHDPTPGVDVGTYHVPGVGEVSLWDFAGQAEYAVTHSMFMDAENTVFIVLYNIKDDSDTQEQEVHYWLSFIKACNPNRQPDVILVASHADKVALSRGRRLATNILALMKAEFKAHLRIADEVILMDCRRTRTDDMSRLKTLLVKIRDSLLQNQQDMPMLCAKIIERLPTWCETKVSPKFPVMTWSDYMSGVKEIDPLVDEDFVEKSTRFLHHLGEILFITPVTSDPIIVLKPNWLCTDVIGPMMAPINFPIPRPERTSKDYVTRAEIQRVFQDVADVDLLIILLQEFQLCHSYDGQTFIFPGLLTQTMPPDKWQPTPEPKVVYFGKQVQCADSTDMFSSGFFPRVQTRLMRELENRPLLWRDGAKCVDRNVEGLIKLSPDGRAVNICVRSAQGDKVQCGKMLQQLENIIADVLDECSPGTGTVEKVLSARALKEHREEFYSYGKEEISKAAAEGGTIVHPTLGFTEQVSDLLCVETPLTRNRPELVQALRHVEPILDHLQARDILSVEECDVIRVNNTPQDGACALLDTVGTKGEDALQVFQSVLGEVEPRAADMLTPTQRTDELQDREDRLTRHRPELVQALRHVEPIPDHLQARDVTEQASDLLSREDSSTHSSSPLFRETRKNEDPVVEGLDPRVPTVLLINDEYGTSKGGISTINCGVGQTLAKAKAVVYATALRVPKQDQEAADRDGVQLIGPDPRGKKTEPTLDWLTDYHGVHYPNLPPDVTCIIGHADITDTAARNIWEQRYKQQANLITITHVIPEDTEYYKGGRKAMKAWEKERDMLDKVDNAKAAFSVGKRIHDHFDTMYKGGRKPQNHYIFLPKPSDVFLTTNVRPGGEQKVVLTAGRVRNVEMLKGHDLAARAMGEVVKEVKNTRLRVRGISEDDWETSKKILEDNLNSRDLNPTLLPYGTQEDIRDDMMTAHLVLLPSRSEPFGLVGLEAIAAGIPEKLHTDRRHVIVETSVNDSDSAGDAKRWADKIKGVLNHSDSEFEKAARFKRELVESRYWEKSHRTFLQACGITTGAADQELPVNIVRRKGDRATRELKAVLEEVNPHAAGMIQDGGSGLLGRKEDPLIKNRPELVRDLTSSAVLGGILNHLLSRDVLSEEECGIIRANRTAHDKARELLDIVGRKGEAARRAFKEALEDVSPHLAELVE